MRRVRHKNLTPMRNNHRGFVLIMALVLLAVMTLIGVSSMNSANMEMRVTANARQHQLAFNNVQSLLEYTLSYGALRNDGQVIDFQSTVKGAAGAQGVAYPSASNNSTASIEFSGCASGVGSSLEQGKGFSFNFYSVSASGTSATNGASSLLNQGVRYPSASCESI